MSTLRSPLKAANSPPNSCFHCQGELPGSPVQVVQESGKIKNFCCSSCRAIWELITERKLGEFYSYRQFDKAVKPERVKPDFINYDSESRFSEFVKTQNGVSMASFLLEGLSCTACAWLAEKVIVNLEGVVNVKMSYPRSLAMVEWQTDRVKLSEIINTFRSFGFNARPYTPSDDLKNLSNKNLSLLYRLGVSGFAAGNIMLFSIALYSGMFYGMEERTRLLFEWVSLVLATPAIFFSASPLTSSMISGLRQKKINMNFPIVLALFITYFYSLFAIFNDNAPYFDTLTIFLFFILLGRHIQGNILLKSLTVSDSLKQLKVNSARVLHGKTYSFTPVKEISQGSMVKVLEGERIPLDGITHGEQQVTVDESMLTGEAAPVYKEIGAPVLSGSALSEGELIYRTTTEEGKNRIDEITALLSSKDDSFSKFISISDRAASWFTVAILALSTATYFFWFLNGGDNPLLTALSVLIVTCPCALGLATPLAQTAANRAAYSRGIAVKSFDAYEIFSRVTHMVFDKTGTITLGKLDIERIKMICENFSETRMLELIYPLEKESRHPIAYAFLKKIKKGSPLAASEIKRIPGMGVSGLVDGNQVVVGNRKIFNKKEIPIPSELRDETESLSTVFCSCNEKIIGQVTFSDRLKPHTHELSDYLHLKEITVSVLTGDTGKASKKAAGALRTAHLRAGLLPVDKMDFIEKARNPSETVVMVGDGFNDTPAFSKADLAIACNTTLDSPLETADVVLLNNDALSIKYLHTLSVRCMKIVRQNLGLSILYNGLALPLAVSGHISPIVAAILMPLSSITVLLNSQRVMKRS